MQNPWNVPEAYIGTDGGSPRSQGSDVSLIDLDFDTLWTPVPEKNRHSPLRRRYGVGREVSGI